MKKILAILIICVLALGLMFGCTSEETNDPSGVTNNDGTNVTQPNNTGNGASTGGPTGSEIPMPPALPE
ncbi:MAG: hypothetical protein HOC95_01710 [Candidatus Diapherotrites archaeon]|nr:hypothetical protein [Candidatus Diapherotrites archaeon]